MINLLSIEKMFFRESKNARKGDSRKMANFPPNACLFIEEYNKGISL